MEAICPNCRKKFIQNTGKQVWCCRKCRDAYTHRAKRRLANISSREEYHRLWQKYFRYHIPIDGYEEKSCNYCGKIFTPKTRVQKYCSRSCKSKFISRSHHWEYSVRNVSSSPRNYINSLLSHKHRRDYLDLEYMMGIYDAQNGKCALSGVTMTYQRGNGNVPTNISIDRIDSNKGYIKGNVQLVCRIVNVMKNEWKQDDFIEFCKKIVEKSEEKRAS